MFQLVLSDLRISLLSINLSAMFYISRTIFVAMFLIVYIIYLLRNKAFNLFVCTGFELVFIFFITARILPFVYLICKKVLIIIIIMVQHIAFAIQNSFIDKLIIFVIMAL